MVRMLNTDRHIALSGGWVAGPAFGVAMMAAPEYFHFGPWTSAVLFWGGIGVFLGTIAVVALVSSHTEGKRRAVRGPIIAMVLGALIFCGGAAWYFWPSQMKLEDSHDSSGRGALKRRTDTLTQELLDFTFAREGQINQWMQEAIAQNFLAAINNDPAGPEKFRQKLMARNAETRDRFLKFYWPQVVSLKDDLSAAGVDLSPVSRAVALDGPRKIGLMLSVLAERIGKKPPFPRVLTRLQAKAVIHGNRKDRVEIHAFLDDKNSAQIAETMRLEFSADGWPVDEVIHPLPESNLHGIHVVYPSADMATVLENITPSLQACELETVIEVRPSKAATNHHQN
jgi:hypothetical protein